VYFFCEATAQLYPRHFNVEVYGSHKLRHTHTHTHTKSVELPLTSDQPVLKAFNYTIHNKHKERIPMPSAEFEPAIPVIKLLQDRRLRPQGYMELQILCLCPTYYIHLNFFTCGSPFSAYRKYRTNPPAEHQIISKSSVKSLEVIRVSLSRNP
jgi:hypothetical protein